MPSAAEAQGAIDPCGIGLVVGQLNMGSKRSGKVAIGILGALLDADERVEALVQGRYRGEDAVAALTPRRLLFVNDREWKPDVLEVAIDSTTTVQGWQDDRTAALVVQTGTVTATVDQINEREMAQVLAAAIRGRAGT